jgi:MFS family permease
MDALFFGFMAWSLIFAGLLASPKLKRLFHLETKDSNQPLLTNETVDVDKTVSISEQAQPKSKSFWSLVMEIVSYESVCGYVPYFWLMTFVQGSANSLINNYLFLMLTEELHAPSEVLGWTSLTRVLLEIPFFVWSGTLSNQIQRLFTRGSSAESQNDARWMLVFAVALTALRVGLYTLMSIFKWNPIIDVFIELLHGIIYATFYASAVQIAAVSAPAHLQATSQGIYAAIFSGFGATFGNFFGGIIYNYLGPSTLFAMTFVLCSGSALLYSFYIKFSRTRRPSVQVVK